MSGNPYNPSSQLSGAGSKANTPVDGTFDPADQRTLFGHPTGLYTLFFAEMWERFSYYGMRALLVFYMIKGFLKYGDGEAYSVYGAYTALVYMTPFFGGMIADKILGKRRAVVVGGVLMALGHLLMTVEHSLAFFFALALLIAGNGFFKPNISSIVGLLYPPNAPGRDGGFTIFYMGINLGAAMSPLLCGYIGETYGWHWGFGLATVGMLTGLAVFVMPTLFTQLLIGAGALAAIVSLLIFRPNNNVAIATNLFIAIALLIAAVAALIALQRGGLPAAAGRRDAEPTDPGWLGLPKSEWMVYLGTLISIPVFALLVSGLKPINDGVQYQLVAEATIEAMKASESPMVRTFSTVVEEVSKPAGLVLFITGIGALAYLVSQMMRLDRVARDRMVVVLVLTFFSLLFWAIFEQAGSSLNNFTDRNIDRVSESRVVDAAMVGQTIELQPTQEQLGYQHQGTVMNLTELDRLRSENAGKPNFTIPWTITEDNLGMGIAERDAELPASTFQAANPVYILLFGLILSALWTYLGQRGLEPSTPVKFAFGLMQLGLGFGAFWLGAQNADARGMVAVGWLLLGYLLQTTGELCLSPVGLSMVTKLSPKFLVSTVMGTWFLATAFSQYLAGIISQFTRIETDGSTDIPPPLATVDVYGDVFGIIALFGIVSGVVLLLLSPLLKKLMHPEVGEEG